MAKREQYTTQQMIDALVATRGMTTLAAQRLGCSWNTVNRYVQKYQTVKDALRQAREGLGDQVELTLINEALGRRDKVGNVIIPPNVTALIFLAKTKFRDRGYSEKLDIGIDLGQVREVIAAIEKLGQTPGDVFGEIIRLAHEQAINADSE